MVRIRRNKTNNNNKNLCHPIPYFNEFNFFLAPHINQVIMWGDGCVNYYKIIISQRTCASNYVLLHTTKSVNYTSIKLKEYKEEI